MAADPILTARGVTRRYGEMIAVDDAALALRSGRITCLLGPSGCGKSTLLRLVAGLEPVDGGEIAAGGRLLSAPGDTVPPEDRGIGIVFQDFALFPHLNVVDNIGFGLSRMKRAARRAEALALLGRFKLAHRADAWPHTLSGGEQQRVAIARALARRPAALLLDEPFSGLDGDLKAEVRHAVLAGLRQARTAVLIVTHDPEEALLMADDLALMAGGRILQAGSAEHCYLRPVSPAAARLLGEANMVPAEVRGGVARTPFGDLPAPGRGDGPATMMVRPEGLRLAGEGAPVTITGIRFGGPYREVIVEAEGVRATLRHAGAGALVLGPAHVALDPERACLF